jgi:CubicO group peptidase (beta-lactamase class C family)
VNAILPAASLSLLAAACAAAPRGGPPAPVPDAGLDAFAATVDSLRAELRIPGLSLAVARDGQVVLARGFGMSDVERGTPATPETVYPIGSVTKTFTATLMVQLAAEGRLDLEDPVAGHVGWQVPPDVRVRHVLSHTSEGTPGTRFAYSSRFNWLDDVVAHATGEPFPALLERRVLRPAGLERTSPGSVDPAAAEAMPGFARPYAPDAAGRPVRSGYPPNGLHSSSGLNSTVLDLVRYAAALDDDRLASAAARERMFSPVVSARGDTLPYGLGWYSQRAAGMRVQWHPGWWPAAYSALLLRVPERGLVLAVLANSDALAAPQLGASSVLLTPVANAFLRQVAAPGEADGEELRGTELIGRGLVARWRGEAARGDSLMRAAAECCPAALRTLADDDLLRVLGESGDPVVRAAGQDAGRRVLAAFPDESGTLFNLGLSYGQVRPGLRIGGAEGAQAVALFERVLALREPIPEWMEGWSAYLAAEWLAASDPARARTLARRAAASGADTDGLQGRVSALLGRLP